MATQVQRPAHILPVIIFSQFAGTSLWFAGNAIVVDLQREWALPMASVGYITSAVQLGFIIGTLAFAFLSLADRHSPRIVFLLCSAAGSAANAILLFIPEGLAPLLVLRFATGFFLAGIYPVGMKIAAGWFDKGLGRALGYLVGALVLGTAFPHLIRSLDGELPWQQVVITVSLFATIGGLVMFLSVPDGPHLPRGSAFDPGALVRVFRSRAFRGSAFGYFGHMWELYAFWTFLPIWIAAYRASASLDANVSLWSFLIIASGFLGCAGGGILSLKVGSVRVAATQLGLSGLCCLASPLFFLASPWLVFAFLVVWGITVVGDSPQFSALNAANAPRAYVGTALTIVNSIGFLITVFSIELINATRILLESQYFFVLLFPGPVLGLIALRNTATASA